MFIVPSLQDIDFVISSQTTLKFDTGKCSTELALFRRMITGITELLSCTFFTGSEEKFGIAGIHFDPHWEIGEMYIPRSDHVTFEDTC